jgi:hypothetical protein
MPSQQHVEVHIGVDGRRIEIACDCLIGREHDFAAWNEAVRGERYTGANSAAS